jgi:hypothetical protein
VTTTIAAGATTTVGPVSYTLDPTQPLLVAFDISATAGEGNLRFGTLPGTNSFSSTSPTAAAALPDRPTGFQSAPNLHSLIEIIQVF